MRHKRQEHPSSDDGASAGVSRSGRRATAGAALQQRLQERLQELEAVLEERTKERDQAREELNAALENKRAGDEAFRRFSESGLFGLGIMELTGRLIFANDALLRLIGRSRADLESFLIQWPDCFPEGTREQASPVLAPPEREGSTAPAEQLLERPDGSHVWCLILAIRTDEQHAVLFVQDTTEHHRDQEALRLQARLLDSVEQAVILTDLGGHVTFWNEFASRMYGWTSEEALGRSILDLTPAPDARKYAAVVLDRLRHGESWSGELRVTRKGGSQFTAWVTDSPVHDEQGALTGIIGVSVDISALKETEHALRTSESRFRTMFDQSPLSMQVFDAHGAIVAANPAWERLWEATVKDLEGYNILHDPQARARGMGPFLERAFAGQAVRMPPMRYDPAEIGRPGRVRWIESYLYPVTDAADRVSEVVLVLTDITEQMEVEAERTRILTLELEARAAAEAAERRLYFLAEASRILSSSLNYQKTLDQVARLAIPMLADWCEIRVLNSEGMLERVAVAHIDPARVALADELERRYPPDPNAARGAYHVARTGETELYREIPDELLVAGARDAEELKITRELGLKSGLVVPLTARGRTLGTFSLIYAESDRRYGDEEVALAEDLARRGGSAIDNSRLYAEAQSSAQLHQEVEEKLTLLTEATSTLIGSLNLDNIFRQILRLAGRLLPADAHALWKHDSGTDRWNIAASEGLSQQYGARVTAVLTHSATMPARPLVISDLSQEPLLAPHRQQLADEGIQAMLVQPLHMHSVVGGTLVFYYRTPHEFDAMEMTVSRALANLAASAIAIAELYEAANRRADQLMEADREKDQFLAMLAHELRNPLGAISSAIQVISHSQPSDPPFGRARDVVARQVRHMARLVDELLDLSLISRGRITLHPDRLDLVELVSATAEDHRRLLEAAGIAFHVRVPEEPLWVQADVTRLRQAFGNLLQNASKFTDPGGQVHLVLEADPSNHGAVLSVADTGIGIEEEMLPRIFEPFVQADRSLDRTRGGLGLGLALVRVIAELHHGRAEAYSPGPGQGSRFVLSLPLENAPADSPNASTKDRTGSARRVLLIEDNPDVAETLRDALEIHGHEVTIAYTGFAGVEQARRIHPEAILCDLGLPGMDGYEVARSLRSDPATKTTRLIAVSGYGQEEDRRRCLAAGFDEHLAKPVDLEQLERLLSEAPAVGSLPAPSN